MAAGAVMKTSDKPELYRYLGFRGTPPAALDRLVDDCLEELSDAAAFLSVSAYFPLVFRDADTLAASDFSFRSRSLSSHTGGCRGLLLFAATLGAGVDRLLMRSASVAIDRAAILGAAAAALLERRADETVGQINRLDYPGERFSARFSPGYGDFSLDAQPLLIRLLDAPKQIGLSLTGGGMLAPSKSITAVIGVGVNPDCEIPASACESCRKSDCPYRRI